MLGFLKNIYTPENFHGEGKRGNFFEGWYYKVADSELGFAMAFIPGIFISKDESRHHSFLQAIDTASNGAVFAGYPPEEFSFSSNPFSVRVSDFLFTKEGIKANLQDEFVSLKADLKFSGLNPWPVTFKSPGIMGWYSYIPFMQCNHGVMSLDHEVTGEITLNGKEYRLKSARGYIEKDWGSSFPKSYVWMQCNNFPETGLSLSASVADIPWLGSRFTGFIIGLYDNGNLLKFTTYNGSKLRGLIVSEDTVEIGCENKTHTLEIVATKTPGAKLRAPYDGELAVDRVGESLNSRIKFNLIEKSSGIERSSEGILAGLEVSGNPAELV